MASSRDFYEVLGVERNASQDEIQRSYRKLARTHHPDINSDPSADERFKEISEAYDVLSDPDTRRKYDAFGHDFRRVPDDVDPETWARARAGAGRSRPGPGGGGTQWYTTDGGPAGDPFGGGGVDFDDLFGEMFGRRAGRSAGRGPIAGADQEAALTLSVEDAFRGGRFSVTLPGPNGQRKIDVNIPAGVIDGQRIRLAGQGAPGSPGAPAGDLYLRVRIAPHSRYRLEGRDVHLDLPVAPWEAALGADVEVTTPGGEVKVHVPRGTSSGSHLRLRGRGLPNPRGEPGAAIVEVRIVVPRTLSDDEQRLFEELAKLSTFEPRKRR
ncbi:MAG: heat shock protein DnaJ protein [Ilumatobacteraceae bacterium]|nr:heat shock protein DnaJ protein [Ilumatobacteraceae bacterium]